MTQTGFLFLPAYVLTIAGLKTASESIQAFTETTSPRTALHQLAGETLS